MLRLKFILSFIIIFSAIYYLNTINKESLINKELKEIVATLQVNFDITNSYNSRDAQSIYFFMKKNKKLYNILSQALDANESQRDILRDRLYRLLKHQYEAMRKRGVLQFHFMFPDTTTFLRMHKPSKYGDYLGDIRYGMLYTNKTHKPSSGFEQGKTSHAFRNVFPIFNDNGKYLGCCDIAYTSEFMQNNLTNINKIHSHFLVNKSIFDTKTWSRKYLILKYIPSIENSEYMYTITGHTDKNRLNLSKLHFIDPNSEIIDANMKKSKKFAIYQKFRGKIKVLAFLPIRNIEDSKTVAYIVSYTDSKHIENILDIYNLINYLLFLTLTIILFLLYGIILRKKSMQLEIKLQTDEIIKKDKIVQEQSKLAAMGEMVGSIAHQWRQPLNSLNINIQNLDDDYAENLIDAEFIDEFIDEQSKTIMFMSKTIDDFRNFFRVNKIKKVFSVREAIETTISIQSAQLKNYNIILEIEGEDFKIDTIESEFHQVILNLISNAKDAIIEKSINHGKIVIKLQRGRITICDNAGGIDEGIIDRIFEPYFTTKEQGKGTGIGLYMSKIIIEQNLGGLIYAKNSKLGAEITIAFKDIL